MNPSFQDLPLLFLSCPDSDFAEYLREADGLASRHPGILRSIDADLDLHAKKKKALRLEDKSWQDHRGILVPIETTPIAPEKLALHAGRPRTPAYVVYMFLIGRGYFGGFKSATAQVLLLESITLRVLLQNKGMPMPAGSTLNEIVNAVSNETRDMILNAELAEVLGEGWDCFDTLVQDSTAVEANTQWPTESGLMVDLLTRLLRQGGLLSRVGMTPFHDSKAQKLLSEMLLLHREISMGTLRRKQAKKNAYTKLLKKARDAIAIVKPYVDRASEDALKLDILPSRKAMALRLTQQMVSDVQNLQKVIDSCHARIVEELEVKAEDKVMSISDPSAAMIVKGGREPVVGYKPQLARSGCGFIVGLIVPLGNAADSTQLIPMFEQVVERTGITPSMVSADDGYASRANREELTGRGAKVSISGSKGKKITGLEEWDSPEFECARNGRSAVESLMFTIKHSFDFGRVARRGLERVRAEMLEKVIAYNLCRMAMNRREAPLAQAA